MNEFNQVAITPLEEWIHYLKTGIIEENAKAPGLAEAREKLKYYSMTPEERYAYDKHINAVMIQNDVLDSAKTEGLEEGFAKGMEQGMEQGRKYKDREIQEIVQKMRTKGYPIEDIADMTGLSVQEIERL